MYETRQNKEKVSRRIDGGSRARQRMKCVCLQLMLLDNWEKNVDTIIREKGITPKNFNKKMICFYTDARIGNKLSKKEKEAVLLYVTHYFNQVSSKEKEQQEVEMHRKEEMAGIRSNLKKIVMRNGHMAGEISNFRQRNGTISGGHLPSEVRSKWENQNCEVEFKPHEDNTCKKSDLTIKYANCTYFKKNSNSSVHTIFPGNISLQMLADTMDTAEKTETDNLFTIRLNGNPIVIETIGLQDPDNGTLYPIV